MPCWLKLPQVSFIRDETDDEVEADIESFESIEVGDDGGESHDGDDGKGESHGNDTINPKNTKNVLAIKSVLNRNYRFAVSITTLILPITDILIIGTALVQSACLKSLFFNLAALAIFLNSSPPIIVLSAPVSITPDVGTPWISIFTYYGLLPWTQTLTTSTVLSTRRF